jgi:DNA ligase (NAD+)
MDIETLRKKIDDANVKYWTDHQPIISDQEYDRLIEQLRVLDPDDPRLTYIGGEKGSVIHNPPMLSLDKRYTHEEIIKWCKSVGREDSTFVVQPKYDGIAGKLVYTTRGWQLSTRGDGHVGEDITSKLPMIEVKTLSSVLLQALRHPNKAAEMLLLNTPFYGEIVITDEDFEEYFTSGKILKQNGEKYNTQRNTVAGLLASKEPLPDLKGKKILTFVDYTFYSSIMSMNMLEDPEEWDKLVLEVEELNYPTDGLVIKLGDIAKIQELGATQHHPRGMMAFKFANESQTSTLRGIEWNVGMRSITPKGIIDPVKIGNVTIQQASLFNLAYVIKNDFRLGDIVKVERAGDVVPHICVEDHVRNQGELMIPHTCPSCGHPTHQEDVELVCTNPDCPGVALAILRKAAKELKLDGFGKVVLMNLVSNKVLQLHQLLSISLEGLCSYADVSPKVATKLYASIQNALRTATPAMLLSALGIPRISKANAAMLLTTCSIEDLTTLSTEHAIEKFQPFGETGLSLVRWLSYSENVQNLALCLMLCTNINHIGQNFDMTICFTGKMSAPRSELESYARSKGYQPVSTVTKELSLLVVPDVEQGDESSKLVKARRYGIQIVTESQFRQM